MWEVLTGFWIIIKLTQRLNDFIMIKKLLLPGIIIAILGGGGCIKETYDMKKLSKRAHLSPTFALSAVKGDISLSDIVKQSDTVVFGEDKLVKIVFKIDSVIDFTIGDFIISKSLVEIISKNPVQPDTKQFNTSINSAKAFIGQGSAAIGPDSIDFDIKEILSHITGTFDISNPSIKINYSNSFTDPIDLNLNLKGFRKDNVVDLNLAPVKLLGPLTPADPEVTASFIIDKNNSSLPELMSMLPEKIYISGNAIMDITGKNGLPGTYLTGNERLFGSLEVEVPMEFRMNNLQFTDTVDNFMKIEDPGNDDPIKPENFGLLRIDISAENGFPLGVSVGMELYDTTATGKSLARVDGNDILKAAPVDINGKVKSGDVTETSTSMEFTKEFFGSINKANKVIFRFTLNSTDSNLDKDVKIYSDYSINFRASLVVKPEIVVDLK